MALSTLVQDWIRIQSQHPSPKSNIPYTALEPPNEIRCLESTGNAPHKKTHLGLINLISLSPLWLKVSLIVKKLSTLSLWIEGAQNINLKQTHTHTKTKNKQANSTTGYTFCDVNTEVTIRHNNVLITSTSRLYIRFPLGIIIKRCHVKT